jgi:hypothetical protein
MDKIENFGLRQTPAKRRSVIGWRRFLRLKIAAVVLALVLTLFCFNWDITYGDTNLECSGLFYLPKSDTGPCDNWGLIHECHGYCDGFDSCAMYGFVAGKWEFYIEILYGWRG